MSGDLVTLPLGDLLTLLLGLWSALLVGDEVAEGLVDILNRVNIGLKFIIYRVDHIHLAIHVGTDGAGLCADRLALIPRNLSGIVSAGLDWDIAALLLLNLITLLNRDDLATLGLIIRLNLGSS